MYPYTLTSYSCVVVVESARSERGTWPVHRLVADPLPPFFAFSFLCLGSFPILAYREKPKTVRCCTHSNTAVRLLEGTINIAVQNIPYSTVLFSKTYCDCTLKIYIESCGGGFKSPCGYCPVHMPYVFLLQ